jgi:predicted ATPase/class 3 adenylate cyclase
VSLPSGTVTFLFTDIEGSTRLMQEVGDRYVEAQVAHHAILRAAFNRSGGRELRTEGDSFFCVFESALDACDAAAEVQREFVEHAWPEGAVLRVRIGLHTGEAPLVGNEYIGIDVHHAARVAGAAHGGQVLVSETTRALVDPSLPDGLSIRDLGMHRLKDLARPEHLYQLVIAGVPDRFPALRTLDSTPNNLPTQLTSFVGREADVAEAGRLLRGTRLLTLTGPGGIGKTRLSLQLAADLVQSFPDGVYFVPLSAVRDPDLISSVLAQVLAVEVTGNRIPVDAVAEFLRDKKLLLVMDNFEQLLPEGAPVISALLNAGTELKLVVSSRAALRVYGEQELPVEPLDIPDVRALPSLALLSQYEAVKLFIDRAMAVKPEFKVTKENAPAIAGICERVDGLPLAIELAAARVKLFSPQALLARLETSLNVLGTGARDLPDRQQTLAGAIAWSYDLLDDPARQVFRRFSVFARGGSLTQAEAVCGLTADLGIDVLTGLDELADQSLLRRLPDFDEPRLLMLQVIREYAGDRLQESGEADATRDRHAAAYEALAEAAAPRLFGPERKQWLERLELDHDNFRVAFDWTVSRGDSPRALGLAAAFWRFWQMRGHLREGRARVETILAMPAADARAEVRARALEAAGGVAYWQGDMAAAQVYYDECLALVREGDDKGKIAAALYNASFPRIVIRSDVPGGIGLVEEALPLFREAGDDAGVARCLWALGNALYFQRRIREAAPALDEAIPLFRKLEDRFSLGWALHTRSLVAMRDADLAMARRYIREALTIFIEGGDLSGMALLVDDAASAALLAGNTTTALRLAAARVASEAATGAGLGSIAGLEESRDWPSFVSTDDQRAAWAAGLAMTLDQAAALALAELNSAIDAEGLTA